jgi:nicotinate-nucleotide adenylyltransferase
MPKQVGILGGTFSPIHIGHLRVAEEALEALKLDSFLFLPAAVPPHKTALPILAFEHRWRLLNLAIADNPRLQALDLEYRLGGKSYTVRSLKALQRHFHGAPELFFLLGLDAFLEVHTWWHYPKLFGLAQMVVMRRSSYREEDLERHLHIHVSDRYRWDALKSRFVHPTLLPVHYLRVTRIDVSSTRIRQLTAQGKSIRYLVPPEVISYIRDNHLYQDVEESPTYHQECGWGECSNPVEAGSLGTKNIFRGDNQE